MAHLIPIEILKIYLIGRNLSLYENRKNAKSLHPTVCTVRAVFILLCLLCTLHIAHDCPVFCLEIVLSCSYGYCPVLSLVIVLSYSCGDCPVFSRVIVLSCSCGDCPVISLVIVLSYSCFVCQYVDLIIECFCTAFQHCSMPIALSVVCQALMYIVQNTYVLLYSQTKGVKQKYLLYCIFLLSVASHNYLQCELSKYTAIHLTHDGESILH